ncbi:baseplate assembly protein [Halomonas litopenaei]|uniref:baseplate assembly protein n=1 Tax=Halomonas litopenaei TaxID=2109328 RepID=UPI003FA11273
MTTAIDLSRLPAPAVVEPLDFETILAERKARLLELTPSDEREALAATLSLESEPVTKLLQENAYRELVLRQRINDAARAVMVATAAGADLDQLAALFGVSRLTGEADDDLRQRIVLALEGYPTAGPAGAYAFHARSAHPEVKDVAVTSPVPGLVRLAILARSGDGSPDDAILEAVRAAVTDEKVRPLTDSVAVVAARVTSYTLRATLIIEPGPSPDTVLQAAEAAARDYAESRHALGAYVALSGIAAALHQPGVRRVDLESPTGDLDIPADGAAYLAELTLATEVAS